MAGSSISFANRRDEPIDVYVEPWPERFRLKPGETLEIRQARAPDGDSIVLAAHAEGITIDGSIEEGAEFLIDGQPARHRSWMD